MKIATSIRSLYAELQPSCVALQKKVDELLRIEANTRRWHYESRVKSEQSFALKLESGRIQNPAELEDFFACTLVVRNLGQIAEAERVVRELFEFVERRPGDALKTDKNPDAFPFDDLRLYVRWRDDDTLRPTRLQGKRFEVQIKTFLQHAWGIATHDLVYKTDDVSWSKQRIAYQVKAMLEHAEVTIQEADRLAATAALAKTQTRTERIKEIITIVRDSWDQEALPADLKRLAENIQAVMSFAQADSEHLRRVLQAERKRQNGALPLNLSPYAIVVQAFAWHEGDVFRAALSDRK
jgi:ppGpp synthetase/RelA/SpoT-type nucleotidyltranferase